MGLLDNLFSNDPRTQGLLAGSAALLQAGGPSRMPVSLGQGLAAAFGAGQGAFNNAQEQSLAKQLREIQLKQLEDAQQERQRKLDQQQQLADLWKNSTALGDQSEGTFDRQKFIQGLGAIDPMKAFELSQKPEDELMSVAPGASVIGKRTGTLRFTAPDKAAKGTSDMQEFEYATQRGEVPAGMSFTEWMRANKRAGATNITNKIDARTGESLAREVGPMVKASRDVGMSGVKLVDTASRILDAADRENLYAGPLANLQLKAAQWGDKLGITGKDTAEKIKNTREVIRGMAEQAVAARSTLGSQAQISNAEQELLTKATSGDIGDLTHSEVAQIANLNDRLGRQLYGQHQEQLANMQKDPGLTSLAKFYSLPPLPPARKPKAKTADPTAGWDEAKRKRYEAWKAQQK